MVRHSKWEPGDNYIRERFAWNIDAAPKTVGTEKNTARCGSALFEEFSTWRAAPLHEEVHFLRREKFLHLRGHLLQIAVAREKDKRAPLGFFDKMRGPTFQFFLISGVARVGHFLHDEDFHLLLKVERAAKLQRLGVGRADARPEIRQVGAADRKRGAGHNGGTIVPENHPAQHRRQIDRRGVERQKLRGLSRALDPINMFACTLFQENGDAIASITNATPKFLQFSF